MTIFRSLFPDCFLDVVDLLLLVRPITSDGPAVVEAEARLAVTGGIVDVGIS